MVKLRGPALSTQAAGTLGAQLTFSNWKGRAYLKKHRKPKQPNTDPQLAMRAVVDFLGREWAKLTPDQIATWAAIAKPRNITAFNQYLGTGCQRWRNFKAPARYHPPTETGNFGTFDWPTITPVPRGLRFHGNCSGPGYGWGLPIIQVPHWADPYTWHGLRKIIPYREEDTYDWTWTPLPPGTYYFANTVMNVNGRLYDTFLSQQGIVT